MPTVAQGTEVRAEILRLGVKFCSPGDISGFNIAAIFSLAPAHVGRAFLNVTHGANLTAPQSVSNFIFAVWKKEC